MKRKLSIMLAVLLVVPTILSACNNSSSGQSASTPSTESSQTNALSSGDDKNDSPPVSITVEITDRGETVGNTTTADNPMTAWIKEQVKQELNIDVTYVPVPKSEEVTKLNAMMAAGNAPDLAFTYKSNVIANFAMQGGLTDLGPIIEQYGENITASLGDILEDGFMYGAQYAIPSKRVDEYDKYATYINKTLLDKYNIEMPATTEQFYNAMLTIKANEPDVVPYSMHDPSFNLKTFQDIITPFTEIGKANSFDQRDIAIYGGWTMLLAPGSKDGYKEMNKWYHEGLISTDFALDNESKTWRADIENGRVFAFSDHHKGGFMFAQAAFNSNGSYYVPLNTFTDREGYYFKEIYRLTGLYNIVPEVSSKNAEAVVKYLNWLSAPDNYNMIKSGMAVGGAEIDENGIYVTLPKNEFQAKTGMFNGIVNDVAVLVKSDIEYDSNEKYINKWTSQYSSGDFDSTEMIKTLYDIASPTGGYVIPASSAPTDAESKYEANVRSHAAAMAARLIVCNPSEFDALWDKEYKELEVEGLTSILESRAERYDSEQ